MTDSPADRGRVLLRIQGAIRAYLADVALLDPPVFHGPDLYRWVNARVPCAPDSPRRIAAELGLVECVSRSRSLYRLTAPARAGGTSPPPLPPGQAPSSPTAPATRPIPSEAMPREGPGATISAEQLGLLEGWRYE